MSDARVRWLLTMLAVAAFVRFVMAVRTAVKYTGTPKDDSDSDIAAVAAYATVFTYVMFLWWVPE